MILPQWAWSVPSVVIDNCFFSIFQHYSRGTITTFTYYTPKALLLLYFVSGNFLGDLDGKLLQCFDGFMYEAQ